MFSVIDRLAGRQCFGRLFHFAVQSPVIEVDDVAVAINHSGQPHVMGGGIGQAERLKLVGRIGVLGDFGIGRF